ncbi:MAG: S-methyl-5-thioribose-1-phosphate isomerase [Verrucomicrobiota bacterium]
MRVDGVSYRTVWQNANGSVGIIDQRWLPFRFETVEVTSTEQACLVIREMYVRGAGCIGAFAGGAMWLAAQEAASETDTLEAFRGAWGQKASQLAGTRPTAVNLQWAIERQFEEAGRAESVEKIVSASRTLAAKIADEDAEWCRQIGQHGVSVIEKIFDEKGKKGPVNILTHCNAGWLAFVDYGSATAPIYEAFEAGIPVHVWVDETRPRNQGARLTAWELGQHGVPHTVIVDNAGGHLMQRGEVDLVITGTDRTTHTGDVANKIGTYLKALAAKDNGIPFYVALPSSTFDWKMKDGLEEVPIEERDGSEVGVMTGLSVELPPKREEEEVEIVAPGSPVANPAFDVTPRRLVTGLITERGICEANEEAIRALFPEK